jgi:ribosome-binding protein aMBF1 (putative translation factor)
MDENILNHQDWKTIVLKSKNKSNLDRKSPCKKSGGSRIVKIEKMAMNDDLKHKKIDNELKNIIQKKRCEKKLTQAALAKQINVNISVIRDIESGKSNYNPKDINKIKKFLNISSKIK